MGKRVRDLGKRVERKGFSTEHPNPKHNPDSQQTEQSETTKGKASPKNDPP